MASEISVTGLSDLNAQLDQFAVTLEKKMLRGALRAGQKVILEEAFHLCPVQTEKLRDSLRISTKARGDLVQATVKAGNKQAWYAHFVEFGTAAHFIKPKSAKSLFFAGIMRDGVDHPGAIKKPFMRQAFDTKSAAAIDAFASYLRKRIEKESLKELAMQPDETDGVTK